jgi:hypothetical protein
MIMVTVMIQRTVKVRLELILAVVVVTRHPNPPKSVPPPVGVVLPSAVGRLSLLLEKPELRFRFWRRSLPRRNPLP